jgi:hypothetical protein
MGLRFFLNNIEINPPLEWQGVQIMATFDNSSVQANITTDEFTFVNEEAESIQAWLDQFGYFVGMPFVIQYKSFVAFNGFLDFTSFKQIEKGRVQCKLRKFNGLNTLDDRSRANSDGYLESLGRITNSDYVNVPYLVERVDNDFEQLILIVTIYMIAYQLQQLIKDIAKNIALIASTVAGGITGPIAAAVLAIAVAAIELAFAVVILFELIKLVGKLLELIFPPVRNHKAMTLRRALEIASDYFGYTLETTINELDNVVYLPSKPNGNKPIQRGIPNVSDFGYQISEMFELIATAFNAKYRIVENTLQVHSEGSDYWLSQSGYTLPDVLNEQRQYNNADLPARTLIAFNTDTADDWTVDDWTGTNYEIVTSHTFEVSQNQNLLKGLKEVAIPCALGSVKDKNSVVETLGEALLDVARRFSNLLGGNLADTVPNRKGVLKLSQKIHTVPKLLWLENGKIPLNHREKWIAKVIWEKYYQKTSFVGFDTIGQRRLIEEEKIPFSFEDFLLITNNSYFWTNNGQRGKMESVKWQLDSDFAIVDYWINERYDNNLTETYIEP